MKKKNTSDMLRFSSSTELCFLGNATKIQEEFCWVTVLAFEKCCLGSPLIWEKIVHHLTRRTLIKHIVNAKFCTAT